MGKCVNHPESLNQLIWGQPWASILSKLTEWLWCAAWIKDHQARKRIKDAVLPHLLPSFLYKTCPTPVMTQESINAHSDTCHKRETHGSQSQSEKQWDLILFGTFGGFLENEQTETWRANSRKREPHLCKGSQKGLHAQGSQIRPLWPKGRGREGFGARGVWRIQKGLDHAGSFQPGHSRGNWTSQNTLHIWLFFLFLPSLLSLLSFPPLLTLAPFPLTSFLHPFLCLALYIFSLTGK